MPRRWFHVVIFARYILGEQVRVFAPVRCRDRVDRGVYSFCNPRFTVEGDQRVALAMMGAIIGVAAYSCGALVQIHVRRLVQPNRRRPSCLTFHVTATCFRSLPCPQGWDQLGAALWV